MREPALHLGLVLRAAYARVVKALVLVLAGVAGAGVLAMTGVTCLDVILRAFGNPLTGAYDLVKLTGAVAVASAMPYTTAVKGHVAIEYFFQKLGRRGRVVVDTLGRLLGIALFALLGWQSLQYGCALHDNGVVTATLQLPVFWVAYVIAFACVLVALVVLYPLLHPGEEIVRS